MSRKRKGYPSRYDRQQDAKIRRLENMQVKKQHTQDTATTLTQNVMQFFSLNLVPQGETYLSREGAEIQLSSCSLRFNLLGSAVATINTGAVRILVLIDNDPRGALPTATQILTTQNVLSAYNTGLVVGQERSRGRFKFLYDETFIMVNRPIASADSLPQNTIGKGYFRFKQLPIMFTADTGAITEIQENNVVLCAISIDNAQTIKFDFFAKMMFTTPD